MNQDEVILGVDTHLDVHVGAVISCTGRLLGTQAVETTAAGYLRLLDWARSFGELRRAGVEGTATYGAGLTRLMRDHGVEVFEVNRPDRSARRTRGKSDPTDAESAAWPFSQAVRQPSLNSSLALRTRCALSQRHAGAR